YGTSMHHGTIDDAEGTKKFIEGRNEGEKYNIYKLVKL
ncbi:unnamed protein product, partial [marine sediment metagenome]